MKYLDIEGISIPYKITKKNNKNTYFYFKKEGYIQINLSTYQRESDALNYIKQHKTKFIHKLQRSTSKQTRNQNELSILGVPYTLVLHKKNEVLVDEENRVLYTPSKDLQSAPLKQFLKGVMMDVLHHLHNTYQSNPYINLDNITYKTRYTTSRHGSCNAKKRNINMSLYLIQYNLRYIEYVYLHEITHFKHQNHGPKFYELLEKLCPDYKSRKRELKQLIR